MSTVNEIRSTFLQFFEKNGHTRVASSSLVPRNDPTLMFTNAGMVQFKDVFTGKEKRPYVRATTAQKVVRAGGKHNDLDNVGYTARHHTFFEMLGNFSFGDYFKENAIELAWKLSTQEFGLPKDRLLVTVYHDDDEAFNLWRKIAGLPDSRIIRIPTADNFWSMGDTGPCGPCSEIFYDQGDKLAGGPPGSPDEDGDRYLEFWNLVFMQYEQTEPGVRHALPHPSIDTGMGLERIAALLQGVQSNYDIDLMRALIRAVAEVTGVSPDGPQSASHRIIADHLRACSFLVADGVLPSNEGRGYVLRRIMRRAMRHAQILGAQDPIMWRLVPALRREMGEAYPELVRAEALITETFRLEETRFRTTLARGLTLLDDASKTLITGASLPGETAFKLYDTYGFPLDLTQDALRQRGISVDLEGFNAAMARQRSDARKAWAGSGETATENVWFGLREEVGATEFLGYENEEASAIVTAIVVDGAPAEALRLGQTGYMVVNQTPFYGESGGQIGDTGTFSGKSFAGKVTNTQKRLGDLFVHEIKLESGQLKVGDVVALTVHHARRKEICANHSATHLLHEALRQVLGDHVAQKGSLVAPDRLRFDFAHPKPISAEEIEAAEARANAIVLQNAPIVTKLMGQEAAIASGARALFGEKYGDEVRVVAMGEGENPDGPAWSVELCGGTHATRTGDIGLITIVSEGAVASGVRRIEAKTGDAARQHLNAEARRMRAVANLLRTSAEDAPERLTNLMEERRKLDRDLSETRKKLAMSQNDETEDPISQVGNVQFYKKVVQGIEMKDLKSLAEAAVDKIGSGIVAITALSEDQKAGLIIALSPDMAEKFNAVDMVRIGAEALGGKGGGGKRNLAQAGGPNGTRENAASANNAIAAFIAANA
ncbi:MAG: alanine--tRNA ligase [Hyphomicrobiales bacterium]|nr:alanine--tRNA ligase [Hyphomicrobiales bacterium]MDE2114843.1 alanine--tRNA ligase [Hyphomicrobiales bacterium]